MNDQKTELMDAAALKSNFPAIEFAYPIAINSYDVLAKRIEAIDNKLQTQTALMISLFVVIPTLLKAQGTAYFSLWFYLSMLLLVIGIVISIYARYVGTLKVLNPNTLKEHYIQFEEYIFKYEMILHAGDAYTANHKLVERKWHNLVYSLISFSLAMVSLVVWVTVSQF